MDVWVWILGIGGACLLWVILKWLFIGPEERNFDESVRKCMDTQAQKRNGRVNVTHGRPTLTVPYKSVKIDVSLYEDNNELYNQHTYARFRTQVFTNKEFRILRDSKDFFLKPLVLGARLKILDEKFSESYIVKGNDASFVNDLLTPEIRDKLLAESVHVKFGGRTDSSRLSRERGWLSVFTPVMRVGDEVFNELIETAILFYERLEALNGHVGQQPND